MTYRFGLLLLVLLFAASACASERSSSPEAPADTAPTTSSTAAAPADSLYRSALRTHVGTDTAAYLGDRDELRQALRRFYDQTGYARAWTDADGVRPPAEALLQAVRTAEEEGLAHAGYDLDRLERALDETYAADGPPRPEAVARLDALLSFTFVRHARDLYAGQLSPQDVDPRWYTDREPLDLAALLEKATSYDRVEETLRTLTPDHDGYRRLKRALQQYDALVADGGWPPIPTGEALTRGNRSARILPLRERLAATGDLDSNAVRPDSTFDAEVAAALARFQRRHHLVVDTVLGGSTLEALNVPAEQRARTIRLNLERWHWLPQSFADRHVMVNIPAFTLRAYEAGGRALEMDVVVGKEYDDRATPIFADVIEHLIFNPFWNVPPGIARDEILSQARQDPDYLAANDYEITSHYGPDAEVYPATAENMDRVAAGELRIRQEAGPRNALGLVKFMFPNQYAVYLHDSPAEQLFDRRERAFSHGCVRVERPRDLAAYALAGTSGWDRARIRTTMDGAEWQKVVLNENIPVYLLYWTAYVDPDTEGVQFHDDFYGHDQALADALEAETRAG